MIFRGGFRIFLKPPYKIFSGLNQNQFSAAALAAAELHANRPHINGARITIGMAYRMPSIVTVAGEIHKNRNVAAYDATHAMSRIRLERHHSYMAKQNIHVVQIVFENSKLMTGSCSN